MSRARGDSGGGGAMLADVRGGHVNSAKQLSHMPPGPALLATFALLGETTEEIWQIEQRVIDVMLDTLSCLLALLTNVMQ